ncbi:hypothetical protein ACOM2C_02425 [Pseudarthrobacter sp. So.54]
MWAPATPLVAVIPVIFPAAGVNAVVLPLRSARDFTRPSELKITTEALVREVSV